MAHSEKTDIWYPNDKALLVRFHGPTHFKGSRVRITDKEATEGKKFKTLSYSHGGGGTLDQAIAYLESTGAQIVSLAEQPDHYIVTVRRPYHLK